MPSRIQKTSHWKQMFDFSARLMSEQDEISGVETIGRENHSWKCMILIGDERIINLQRTKDYVFSDSVLCFGKFFENPESHEWEQRLGWFKSSSLYRTSDRNDDEPMEFEWSIFPGFNTLQLSEEVKKLLHKSGETPENFTGRIIFISMKKNVLQILDSYLCIARRFGKGQWSFIGPGSEKKWYSIKEDSPQRIWDKIAERMLLEFAESGCPIFRITTPLSGGQLKSKGHGKLSIHCCVDLDTIKTFFRTVISVNQLSLYGAVAEICEEYETFHDRTGQPVVGRQSSSSLVPKRDQDKRAFK